MDPQLTIKVKTAPIFRFIYPCLLVVISIVILYYTSFTTTDWWNSGFYASCAYSLGVPLQGDSILYILLGRVFVVLLPFVSVFKALTMVSVVSTTGAALCLYYSLISILRYINPNQSERNISFCAFITAISLPFIYSVWSNSLSPNGYALGFFLSSLLILLSVKVCLTREESFRVKLFMLIAFVMGVDFAAHRLNNPFLLIVPIVTLFVMRKNLLRWKFWVSVVVFFITGFSLHLYLLIRGSHNPPVDLGFVSSWEDLISWITMKRMGESNLSILFERRAPLWSYQIGHMYLRYFGWNFLGKNYDATIAPFKYFLTIAFILGCCGAIYSFAKKPRAAFLHLFAFVSCSFLLIIYLNIWDDFFREIDRLYLASFLIFLIWVGIGFNFIYTQGLGRFPFIRRYPNSMNVIIKLILCFILPVCIIVSNWRWCDKSRYTFAEDWAYNILNSCENNAILFTNGDNDSFPLWFCQDIMGIRQDVTVMNVNLLNIPQYAIKISRGLPDILASVQDSELVQLEPSINPQVKEFISVLPKTRLELKLPSKDRKPYIMVADKLILRIIEENAWKHPIYFAATVSPDALIALKPYLSRGGLSSKLCPEPQANLNIPELEKQLTQTFRFRNFNDSSVWVEKNDREQEPSIALSQNYRSVFVELCNYYLHEGDNRKKAQELFNFMNQKIPQWRFTPAQNKLVEELEQSLQHQ